MSHAADSHDFITVHGARENNLKDVSVRIPKRRITVFTGVSGSGKSSLVFSTIAAESQRLINETYSSFIQGFLPQISRPDVDLLEGITTAIIVDQSRLGSDPRSTVGTATDVNAMLRILFSKLAQPYIGPAKAFSFNVASVSGAGAITVNKGGRELKEKRTFQVVGGMCPRCEGRGEVSDFDFSAIYDETKSLNEGAILVPGVSMEGWYGRLYKESGFFNPDKPIAKYTKKELDNLLYKEPTKIKVDGVNLTFYGLIPQIKKSMLSKDVESMQAHIRRFVEKAVVFKTCPECEGTRLTAAAQSAKIKGKSIADICRMQISDVHTWITEIDEPTLKPLLDSLQASLQSFIDIGLGYLSLDRPTGTLSGGESQRTKMIRHLGSSLTDVTYIFDEPTIGLHPHDIQRMNDLLIKLRDKGNTVLVVEHKPEVIAIADYIIDLGPAAGKNGGEIMYVGDASKLSSAESLTAQHLNYRAALKESTRKASGAIEIRGANQNNLQNVDVDIPLGILTVITGVAGSGKSSLVSSQLSNLDSVVTVDQSPIKGSTRSNSATYTGIMDSIRTAFAKANAVKPALFSANSEGACPTCKGAGMIYTDLGMIASTGVLCEDCEGRRYAPEVLQYTLADKNIADVLEMAVSDAAKFFAGDNSENVKVPKAAKVLQQLVQVGLGYIQLGQSLSTLSGGERQRLKLAIAMSENADVYLLDEPTTGLHLADVQNLLALLDEIVDSGKSVIVIEHHQAVMAHADYIIDLGPGAGKDGGKIVFAGTPAELVKNAKASKTAEHLAQYTKQKAQ